MVMTSISTKDRMFVCHALPSNSDVLPSKNVSNFARIEMKL